MPPILKKKLVGTEGSQFEQTWSWGQVPRFIDYSVPWRPEYPSEMSAIQIMDAAWIMDKYKFCDWEELRCHHNTSYQNDGKKNNNFSNASKEGPECSVFVLDPDEGDALWAAVGVVGGLGHVVGHALEPATIRSERNKTVKITLSTSSNFSLFPRWSHKFSWSFIWETGQSGDMCVTERSRSWLRDVRLCRG